MTTQNVIPNTKYTYEAPCGIDVIELAYLSQGHKMQYQISNMHMEYHMYLVINQYVVCITRT